MGDWTQGCLGPGEGLLVLQSPGLDPRGVGVPMVALLATGGHGFSGDSSFLGRGDSTGLFPGWLAVLPFMDQGSGCRSGDGRALAVSLSCKNITAQTSHLEGAAAE